MRLKPKRQLQILSESGREPEVSKIVDDTIFLRVFFNVDVAAALENNAILYNFRVLQPQPSLKSKQKLGALDSSVSLNAPSVRKLSAQARRSSVVAQGTVDITSSIPNDMIKKAIDGSGIRTRKLIRFVKSGEDNAIEARGSEPSIEDQIVKNTNSILPFRLDTIHVSSKDPASEINTADFHKPVQASIRGLRSTSDLSKLTLRQKLFRKSLTTQTSASRRVKIENEVERNVEISCEFKLNKSLLRKYSFEIDATSRSSSVSIFSVLQTISFTVDLREAFEEFIIPTEPPQVEITSVGSMRFIRAKQTDKNSKSLRVYRRIIETSEQNPEPFSLIANIPALVGEYIQFVDRPDTDGKCIYRVVPFNEISMTSGHFSGAVTRGTRAINQRNYPDTATVLATESNNSIKIRAFNIPNEVVAVRLLRRSLSLHEREFKSPPTIVSKPLQQLDRSNGLVEFSDSPRRSNSVYEYTVDMIDSRGNVRRASKTSVVNFVGDSAKSEYHKLVVSSQSTTLDPRPKVSFQVEAPNNESSLNLLYSILAGAGLDSQYIDEIKQNRELFGKIAGLEMLRFDTVTGLNESFGLIQVGVFEDSSRSRESKNVSEPVQGRTYIYQFRLLLRASSTLFDSATVSNVDLETGKAYSTSMKKFNSPNVFRRGTLKATSEQLNITSKTGLRLASSRSSEGEMYQGITSLVGELQVTIPARQTTLNNVSAESTPRGNVIRWKIDQGSQIIDHFIILADYGGKLAPLRAIHFTNQNNMLYLDNKIAAQLDNVKYYVQPIFADFSEGPMAGPAEF